jgi:hypothetical protein
LDFRIAPIRILPRITSDQPATGDVLRPPTTISEAEVEKYVQYLQKHGPQRMGPMVSKPDATTESPTPYAWFEVATPPQTPGLVTAQHQDKTYVLLSMLAGHVMLSGIQAEASWDVDEVQLTTDQFGSPVIAITLDPAGGDALSTLSRSHQGDYLAILARDHVVTVARLVSPLGRQVHITGSFTEQEARWFARLLMVDEEHGDAPPQPLTGSENRIDAEPPVVDAPSAR